MDDIFDEMSYNSNSDSIVMGVLRSALDRAQEKVQCRDGPIGFLHERSRFYEVAALLVEAGLNIIQEESDFLESSHEKIRLDLMEIEHWLHGRIKQMKLLIVDKDKELKERAENELKLRQALEFKEKELAYLREEISTSESFQGECKEGSVCELGSSLDQRVWDIKQKPEDDVNADHLEPNESSDGEKDRSIEFRKDDVQGEGQLFGTDSVRPENIIIQQMSSDIDILKDTLGLAFGRMQKAEVLPLEKQWRWSIEKDVMSILIRGFMDDIKPSCVDCASDLKEELSNLNEVRDHQDMQASIMEEIYLILFQGLREDFDLELSNYAVESLARNDKSGPLVKYDSSSNGSILVDSQPDKADKNEIKYSTSSIVLQHDLESSVREDVYAVFFKEMVTEWRGRMEYFTDECLVKEEMFRIVFAEMVKNTVSTASLEKSQLNSEIRPLLPHLGYGLGISADALQKGDLHKQIEIDASLQVESERRYTDYQLEKSHAGQTKPSDTNTVFLPPAELQQIYMDFEQMAHGKLERNCLRVEKLKPKLTTLVSPIISIKEKKLLYEKAFLTRCHNLQLAEDEVDLLADQVDRLLYLLENIYIVMNQNSTVLSHYFGVSDVLKLIEKELADGGADTVQD